MRRLSLIACFALGLMPAAGAHDSHGQWPQFAESTADVQDWAHHLKSRGGGMCCSGADGQPAEAEWDNDQGHYRVKIEGKWIDVPDEAVIKEPNKFGYAVVWWYKIWMGTGDLQPAVRCFIPGADI